MTLPVPVLAVLGALLFLALVAAGCFLGLWLGERGRRRDLVWLVEKEERPISPPEAIVRRAVHPDEQLVGEVEIAALADRILLEAERDGRHVSDAEAIRDARAMLLAADSQAQAIAGGVNR